MPICVIMSICLVFPPINNTLRTLAQKTGISEYKAPVSPKNRFEKYFEWAYPDMDAIPGVGYSVYGIEVTEQYSPPDMLGLRLGTPQGFAIKAIAQPGESVIVSCGETPELGKTATIESPSLGLAFIAGNLAACRDGEHRAGTTIARANQEGGLYWQQMNQGQPEAPEAGYLWWAFLGYEPNFKR